MYKLDGDVLKSSIKDIRWIEIPKGTAIIGSTLEEIEAANDYWKTRLLDPSYNEKFKEWLLKEYPSHEVELKPFLISDILVTNGMYKEFCLDMGSDISEPESLVNKDLGGDMTCPIWGVTIQEAFQFADWFSMKYGVKASLPTEAQWEYAARGSTRRVYPWGNDFSPTKCNSFESNIGRTSPVRSYEAGKSYFGLYDMGGNVEEWVDTKYNVYPFGVKITDDLVDELGEKYYILKGGSFARGGDLCRVARRHGRHPDDVFRYTGFRLVIN
ncbi:formylglycine-generating enzyme family protein [Bacillus sp. FJAT-45037]|uniref:formylglycine-generating enzyme family protein n=1 Tax=Bacillus sp. FJAT-45037 TaxID=2011007 RepID=UPI000C242486|nr:SUMF1/EgtB/PvdO family nonheme iron enzyme [Bacillus sp. FJAT-45037]